MDILIVSATELEIEPFLQQKYKADVLITGVGIPATVFHLTKKLIAKNYILAIQAGVAGTFGNGLELTDVALVKEDVFADSGIEEKGNFHTLFETGLAGNNDFPYVNGWLINDNPLLNKLQLPLAKAITINKITDNQSTWQPLQQKFSASLESMEGAAFHYVCLQQKINFLQLRAVSNMVGERNKSKWEMKNAIENLNSELLKIIKQF